MENREARDRGQGADRDSPRCLTAPGMKTKNWRRTIKNPKVFGWGFFSFLKNLFCFSPHSWCFLWINIVVAVPLSLKNAGQLVVGGQFAGVILLLRVASRKSKCCGDMQGITTVLPWSWWRETHIEKIEYRTQ